MGPLKDLLKQIYNVKELVQWGGTLGVCAIVFVETGLFVGFFLPGDSLLVTAGIIAAAGQVNLPLLLASVAFCAIAGDQLGYWIGRRMGQSLYNRPDSRFFKRQHLARAHAFYEHHGGKTVILARFVPIIRTFCPPVAGAAEMPYVRYLTYDIFGGIFWVCSTILLGYFLGRAIPNIDRQLHWVIAVIVVLSLIPVARQAYIARRGSSKPVPRTVENP